MNECKNLISNCAAFGLLLLCRKLRVRSREQMGGALTTIWMAVVRNISIVGSILRTLHTTTLAPYHVDPAIIASCLSPENRLLITDRLGSLKRYELKGMERQAAVLVPLCTVFGVPSILFTKRSSNLKRHSGEVRSASAECI